MSEICPAHVFLAADGIGRAEGGVELFVDGVAADVGECSVVVNGPGRDVGEEGGGRALGNVEPALGFVALLDAMSEERVVEAAGDGGDGASGQVALGVGDETQRAGSLQAGAGVRYGGGSVVGAGEAVEVRYSAGLIAPLKTPVAGALWMNV